MKKRLIFFIIIAGLIIVAVGLYLSEGKGTEVEAFKVSRGEISKTIDETGTVKSREQREISVNSPGKVVDVKYEIGDTVNKGDVLFTLDMEASELEIKSLESKLSGIIPSYNQAKRNTENKKSLYEQGAVSFEEYQNTLTLQKQLESQISEIEYTIKQLKEVKSSGSITSPISGVITEIYVKEGETVIIGNPLIEISDLNDLYIEVELLTNEANQISLAAPVTILSEEMGLHLDNGGKVEKIHPKAHATVSDLGIQQKRVPVKISIQEIDKLKIGYDVEVEILSEHREDVLIIFESAVFDMDEKNYVFLIKDDRAELRQVEIGIEDDEYIEIIHGLEEGDLVILSPDEEIEEGTKVVRIKS